MKEKPKHKDQEIFITLRKRRMKCFISQMWAFPVIDGVVYEHIYHQQYREWKGTWKEFYLTHCTYN